jgi:hypothetical protein
MEAICSSETSVDTQRTTGRYIPEDGTLQGFRNLIFCIGRVSTPGMFRAGFGWGEVVCWCEVLLQREL